MNNKERLLDGDRRRVVIENVSPEIEGGCFPVKRVVDEVVTVQADIFADGHDEVCASLLYRKGKSGEWHEVPLKHLGNDRWEGSFVVGEVGIYEYTLRGWIDHFSTWRRDLRKKLKADQDVTFDLFIGARHLEKRGEKAGEHDRQKLRLWARQLKTSSDAAKASSVALSDELADLMATYPDKDFATDYERKLVVMVERERALFSTWYELFPRSCSSGSGKHGTFRECQKLLPRIAEMGFDILYFPPIHPIGKSRRKGKGNSPVSEPGDPGSPWAIGSEEGGHKSIHPELGTMVDFKKLVKEAKKHDIEIAMDLAFQCSRDHPYLKEHPEWFSWHPDGSIQYAENPPKKYEDVVPFNFGTESWRELWEELKSITLFWAEKGIRIFRVDNPHTKPFRFWKWLLGEVRGSYPDVLFLSEAFTKPKVMYHLAKIGFSQSYTYFTWRNTKRELTEYLSELTSTEVREYFRPNFWPNTPDILPEFLQYDGIQGFTIRLILAGTLSSNYGIYGPAFEFCLNEAVTGKEEYLNSEKYEVKSWDWEKPGTLRDFIARVNRIRRENAALQTTRNVKFHDVDNDYMLFYSKTTEDLSNTVLIIVNLDPFHTQSGWVTVPCAELGIESDQPYLVHDLLSDDKYIWQSERNFVELNPHVLPAHVFRVHRRLRREADFDYYM